MKNNLLINLTLSISVCFISPATFGQTQNNNSVVSPKEKFLLSLGGGVSIPVTNLYFKNCWNTNTNLYVPIWRLNSSGSFQTNLGVNAGVGFFQLNSGDITITPAGFQLIGQSSPPKIEAENSKVKRNGFLGEAGLQVNFSLGKITFSPILNVGYLTIKGSETSFKQMSNVNNENHEFILTQRKQEDLKNLLLAPKFRFSYFPGKFGIFAEATYLSSGEIKGTEYTFKPNGPAIRENYYDLKQIVGGQLEQAGENKEKFQVVGLNLGVAIPLGSFENKSTISKAQDFNTTRSNRERRLKVNPDNQENPDSIQPSKITKGQDFNTTRNNRQREPGPGK